MKSTETYIMTAILIFSWNVLQPYVIEKITISQCPHYESTPSRAIALLHIRRNIHMFINVNTADDGT